MLLAASQIGLAAQRPGRFVRLAGGVEEALGGRRCVDERHDHRRRAQQVDAFGCVGRQQLERFGQLDERGRLVLWHAAADAHERRLREQLAVARRAGDRLGLIDQRVRVAVARERQRLRLRQQGERQRALVAVRPGLRDRAVDDR